MSEKKTKKNEVRSGDEAELKNSTQKKKKTSANTKPTTKGKTFEENIIRDSETAKERGKNGGVKSGEVRRAKRDARDTIQYMLGRMAKNPNIANNLEELGFEKEEHCNMSALHGKLFTMAMGGNLEAYMTLMKMGGYEPEENRRERESISADQRRDMEVDAKITALGAKGDNAGVAVNLGDEDGNNDVVIYMPQIEAEEDCEVKDGEKVEENKEENE